MKQGIVKKGKVLAENIPTPVVSDGSVLIKVAYSCISAGTEMTSVNTSKQSIVQRALNSPEEVKTAIEFAKTNGITKTIQRVKGVLDGGKQTGYSASGEIVAIGKGVTNFQVGDKVAAAGAGIANHAEFIDVPINLVMPVPKGMDLKYASTVTLGGIALQGVRRIDLRLGETCVVVGAGILGLLGLQMLKKSGVQVIVSDFDQKRLDLAKELGADLVINPSQEDLLKTVSSFTGGYGTDGVLFTAATSSSKPLSESFKMCRKKGKVVLVGVVGMEIERGDIYAKELDFLISTSYGPGRYDSNYEEKGLDYPYAYVRWTENRNMTEYLRLVHQNYINVGGLIDSIYPIEQITDAFNSLQKEGEKPIIVLLDYTQSSNKELTSKVIISNKTISKETINVGLIGAGSFATGMHLPNMKKLKGKYNLKGVMSRTGFKAKTVADQFEAEYATANFDDIINDSNIDLVLIATRHDSHAELVLKSLKAGKHTFVEKPLAVNQNELDLIKEFYSTPGEKPVLMTGFNRRFSQFATEIKKHTDKRINPLFIQYRMNAGHIPLDHWVHEHGGRIVGEACHLIDLMTYFSGSKMTSISVEKISPNNDKISASDNVSIVLKNEDGSVCNIQYFAVGSKQVSKEYMEVHFDGNTIVMDDYKTLKGYGVKVKEISIGRSDKGQKEELEALYETLKGTKKDWPISLWDMTQTTEATFLINA
ncbi:MAG: bi-domain-containing oxidoreductase [Flavobacteriales bacterium]|nr:bi-domain-containing oxidoreductase [Flavobacteriales bacterium]